MKSNIIILTAIFPNKINLVGNQLENCILSIERLKQSFEIFIVTNNTKKVFRIIKKNNFKLENIIVENINFSNKNYLNNHKLKDFNYTFGKIQSLNIFLQREKKFHSIIISDIDSIFTKKIKNLTNKKNIVLLQ